METSAVTKALRSVLGGLSGQAPGSDAELLERFLSQRDEAAFTALVQRHGPMVLRLCRRMLANPAEVDDAFQATFVVLARRAAAIAKRPSLASWLHGVARNTCFIARRTAKRRRAHEQLLEETAEPCREQAPSPESDLRPILDEELGRLPERYRAPLVLCYLEGRSVDEAATDLGVARGTVASRMSRGRDLLRSRLARRGLALSAAALTAQLESTATAAIPVATLHALVSVGFVSGASIREGAAILAKETLQGMFWSKVRWGGIFLACLLMLGTATVKSTVARGRPAANANVSASEGDDFYVRWRFDDGPPKDIRVGAGEWIWERPRGKPGMMVSPTDVSIMLPTRVPKRPMVLSVRFWPSTQAMAGCAFWADEAGILARQSWYTELKAKKDRAKGFKFYFMENRVVAMPWRTGPDEVYRVQVYARPYPGQNLFLRLSAGGAEEIELRALRSEEVPFPVRNIRQTIKAMKVGPHDMPGHLKWRAIP